jgi:recombination protein RecA
MPTAALREQLAAVMGCPWEWQAKPIPETLPTGIPEVDSLAGGLPRGGLTEICGPVSSGRTSLLDSVMAQATEREEHCALVDAGDAFDPATATAAGVDLARLLWVRCGGRAEHALKVTDLLVQAGGFGLVVLDLGDMPLQTARRISLTSWFRLRRAVEHTPTVLLVLGQQPLAKTCASLVLEAQRDTVLWSGTPGCSRLLGGLRVAAERRKPVRAARVRLEAGIWR